MQVQKDHIRDQLIRAAKVHFMEYGYNKASLRNIAKDINATTGTLYSYFKNKDELLMAVVQPALLYSRQRLSQIQDVKLFMHDLRLEKDKAVEEQYYVITPVVSNFRDELFILFHKSKGTFIEQVVQQQITERAKKYEENLMKMLDMGYTLKMDVDSYFLRLPVIFLFDMLKEMVQVPRSIEELKKMEMNMFTILRACWGSVFDYKP